MVPQGFRGEKLLSLLEGSELVSYKDSSPEVIVAVVAGGGEDVGHPAGGSLRQDSYYQEKAVTLSGQAKEEELGLRNPKPGGSAAFHKSGSLKKRGGCPGLAMTLALLSISIVQNRRNLRSIRGHQMLILGCLY